MAKAKKNWIQQAISKPGALHKALGIKMGIKIPLNTLHKAMNSKNATIAKMANMANTLKGFTKKKKKKTTK